VSKNVAVFVDVANIFFAAKAAGVDIDYVTLLKSASAGRDLVRAYAYTGLDPENENQRNFHDFLRRHGYKVVSKDIRKYGDGKVKANLDIELVVDMMKTARNLDIAIVVSGDGDFAPAIRAVQEMGVRCEVISFRGNTSSDLIEVADLFTDITQLARVEKGSRSGRRVADDDADLSMTEVPDKQTEGTGLGRSGRGRGGRGRGRAGEAEPVAASTSRTRGGRGRGSAPSTNGVASGRDGDAGLVALPGERLSKAVGNLTESDLAAAEVFTLDDAGESIVEPVLGAAGEVDPEGTELREDDAGRRRRRRGGRGRGRGRGREDAAQGAESPSVPGRQASPAPTPDLDEDVDDEPVAPRGPRTTPFGSVWDSQLGTSAAPAAANLTPLSDDDEDFDEPEIPEYLIAEQRRGRTGGARGGQGGRGGPRGGRAAYQSAMDRERYGRGGGGGINRYPDVSGRTAGNGAPTRSPRDDRGFRRDERPRDAAPRPSSSSEPWSEVPPELEAMLRAQVGQKLSPATEPSRQTEASIPDVRIQGAGLYAEARRSLGPEGGRTRLTAGVRLDVARSEAREDRTALYQKYYPTADLALRRDDVLVGGNVQLDRELGGGLSGWVGYGHGTRVPDPQERFLALTGMMGNPDWLGRPDLTPVQSDEVDAGLTWKAPGVVVKAQAFHAWYANYVNLADVNAAAGSTAPLRGRTYENVSARTFGGEATGRVARPGKLFAAAGVSYTRGINDTADSSLPEMPPLKATASLRWDDGRFFAEVEEIYAARQGFVDASLGETATPAWWTTSVKVGAGFRGAKVFAMAQNVFDRYYVEHLSYQRDPFAAGIKVPEPGRSFQLAAQYAY
jgi:uncharacterized LabA/DUF88 family protein